MPIAPVGLPFSSLSSSALHFGSLGSEHYHQLGRIINRDYRLTASDHNIVINAVSGDDLTEFPIEKARFRSIWYSISVSGICTIGYGWTLHSRTVGLQKLRQAQPTDMRPNQHIAIPLILQFLVGLLTAITFNVSVLVFARTCKNRLTLSKICGTLLTDLHPKSPAAAQAANNIVRYSLAGGGLALLQVFLDVMGTGWTFTLFGGICTGCLGLAWLEWRYGKHWSTRLREKGVER